MCLIYPLIPTYDLDEIKKLGKKISEITFKQLISHYIPNSNPKKWYSIVEETNPEQLDKLDKSAITRFVLNKKAIYENKIDLEQICKKIELFIANSGYIQDPDVEWAKCVFSPMNYCTIDIISNIKIPYSAFENILLYGIRGIKDVEFKREKQSDPWYIEAEGSDIQSVLQLEEVDKTRVICNDMWKIYECFGIEATRQFLIEEFTNIISSDGTFINECNVKTLVDMMTHTGTITSISRYSVKKSDTGVLGKASFEESFSNMIEGAQQGAVDTINSVSSAVIVGRGIGIGTGLPVLIQKF